MKTRNLFVSLFAGLVFVACAGTQHTQTSQTDEAQTLIAAWFMPQSVVNFAHALVDNYRPAKDDEPAHALHPGFKNPDWIAFDLRGAVLTAKVPTYEKTPYAPEVDAVRQRYMRDVKAFGAQHPALVKVVYSVVVDAVTSEMIAYARKPITGTEYRNRRAYTDGEISEMFLLYARMVADNLPYLRLAATDLDPNDKEHGYYDRSILAGFGILMDDNARTYHQHVREDLQSSLRGRFGWDMFDQDDMSTWLFARRRYQEGGAALVNTLIDLATDAAKRAAALAEALERGSSGGIGTTN